MVGAKQISKQAEYKNILRKTANWEAYKKILKKQQKVSLEYSHIIWRKYDHLVGRMKKAARSTIPPEPKKRQGRKFVDSRLQTTDNIGRKYGQ